MLCWQSFSGCRREHDAISFDFEGSQYLIYEWLQPFATEVTQDAPPKIGDAPMMLIFRVGHWPYSLLFCQERLPVCWLWIALTTSPFNYPTYKTRHCWRSVDAHFNVVSSQALVPFIIAFMIVWTWWLPFSLIRTWLNGEADPSNILALVALIQLKFKHLTK